MEFLYVSLDTFDVTREKIPTNYESFTPTVDINAGWLVVLKYYTYDSFNEDDEPRYEVLDLYDDRDKAMAVGNSLVDEFSYSTRTPAKRLYNNGKPIKYLPVGGWGSRFEEVIIKRVSIEDHADMVRLC